MFLQICHDFPSLPDPLRMTTGQIRFFYEGLRADLKAQTKPKASK